MSTGDLGLIISGVVDLAAIVAGTVILLRVADRLRVVGPVKQPQQAETAAAEPGPVANLDERRAS